MKLIHDTIRGITAVEVVIGVSIAALVLIFTTNAIVRFVNVGLDIADKTEALYLAEDALEILRFIRDEDWNEVGELTTGTTYYLDVSPSTVAITGTPEIVGTYARSFVTAPVYRDNASDDIVPSGAGTYADADSKYVTATVSWDGGAESVSLTAILTDINE
jgi:hypothetical protein